GELEEDFIRLFSRPYHVVWQHKLPKIRFVKGCGRLDFRFCKSWWFGIGVRIKNRRRCRGVTGPKTKAALLLRVCLSRNCIRQMRDPAGMWRSRSAGKARHGQVEAAPEEMHRTAFATKPRSKFLKHPIDLHQNPPESIGVFLIV